MKEDSKISLEQFLPYIPQLQQLGCIVSEKYDLEVPCSVEDEVNQLLVQAGIHLVPPETSMPYVMEGHNPESHLEKDCLVFYSTGSHIDQLTK